MSRQVGTGLGLVCFDTDEKRVPAEVEWIGPRADSRRPAMAAEASWPWKIPACSPLFW